MVLTNILFAHTTDATGKASAFIKPFIYPWQRWNIKTYKSELMNHCDRVYYRWFERFIIIWNPKPNVYPKQAYQYIIRLTWSLW